MMTNPNTNTENVYQKSEVVYLPTTCEQTNEIKKQPRRSLLTRLHKFKNPLKVPKALLSPDRTVNIFNYYIKEL